MGDFWQNPYVNVFKHYGVGQWKKCLKEGDVTSLMDRVIKSPTFKISGVVPANNYIVIPKHSSQSAGLVGSNLFLLFKPIPGQFFTVHLEVVSKCGVIIRVSISNLYKQFKASATWLQFPFQVDTSADTRKWTVLLLTFPRILHKYINRDFSHVKSIKLCANVFVKNIFTTSRSYNPHIIEKPVLKIDDLTAPQEEAFPREMKFPVPNGHQWKEFYNFVRFPPTSENLSISMTPGKQSPALKPAFVSSKNGERVFKELPVVQNSKSFSSSAIRQPPKKASEKIEEDFQNMSLIENVNISSCKEIKKAHNISKSPPVSRLQKIIGFGPCKKVVFANDTESFYYAAGSLILVQSVDGTSQRVFAGHNDNVLTFALDTMQEHIASSQVNSPLVRIWSTRSGECFALVKSSDDPCCCLHFSDSDKVLLGVTSSRPKSRLILWNTSLLALQGDINIISEASSSDIIKLAKISPVTSSKIASCSARAVHIWRLRAGKLKSCTISSFQGLEHVLQDLAWGTVEGNRDCMVYVATASGLVMEIDSTKAALGRVIDIAAVAGPGVKGINSVSLHSAFAVTGTDDGNLKVWDPLFESVILNVEHESSVTRAVISTDGLKLLAVTETDSIGILDASSKIYKTVLRSHSKKITAVAIDPCKRQLASISQDCSLRTWDLDTGRQVSEVFSAGETPTTIAYHPYKGSIVVGYSKGTIRVISGAGEVVEELYDLAACVTSTTFLPNGEHLFCSDALGTLSVYPANKDSLVMHKSIKHLVGKGGHRGPAAVKASRDSRLVAFVGPTEHCVTVLESDTLTCLTKLDISAAVSSCLDSVHSVVFGTVISRDLFVSTTSGKVLRVDTRTGIIVSEHLPHASASQLLVTDDFVVSACQRKFNVCAYANLACLQKYVGYDEIHDLAFTPSKKDIVMVGHMISLWTFAPINISQPPDHERVPSEVLTKRVSFDDEGSMEPVCPEAPRPSSLEPVQSDVRLEETLNKSGDQTLDMSSILLNTSPAADPPPPVQTISVGNAPESDGELEVVSSLSEDEEEEVPGALAPTNGQHPFQQSLDSSSPRSPEPSAEPPLSARHIVMDNVESTLSSKRYMASHDACGIELRTLVGNEREARDNVVWRGTVLFYTLGNVIIAEDLKTSKQTHLVHHTETITTLAYSSQDRLASCSGAHKLQPSQICIWDAESYELVQTVSFHEHQVQCLKFTVDGSYLMSIGNYKENALVLWDMETYAVHTVAMTDEHVNAVACDPQNATEFVTVGRRAQFWNLDHKQELSVATGTLPLPFTRSIGDAPEFTAVTYSEDGMVYMGTINGHVTLWDPRSVTCLLHWSAHPNEIDVLSCNRSSLVTGGVSRSLKLWNIQNSEADDVSVMLSDELEFDATIVSCVMDDQTNLGIVGTTSGTLWYVNWEEKTSIRLVGGHPDAVNDIAVGKGDNFVVAVEDGSLRVWNYEPLEQALQFQVLSTPCCCAAFRPGSEHRVSAGYGDGTIRTFDLVSVSMVCKMVPHRTPISKLAYSTNGEVLISGDSTGLASIINAETGLIMRVISDHKAQGAGARVTALSFAGLSAHWLLGTADRRVSVWAADWNVDENKMIAWLSFPGPAFTPAGDPLTGEVVLPPSLALFSPIEIHVLLYTGYGICQEISFYHIKRKETLRKVDLAHWATSLSVVPNSNLIVIGSHDRLLTIMDYTSGTFQDYVAHADQLPVVRYWDEKNVIFSAAQTAIAVWGLKI